MSGNSAPTHHTTPHSEIHTLQILNSSVNKHRPAPREILDSAFDLCLECGVWNKECSVERAPDPTPLYQPLRGERGYFKHFG